MRESKIQYNPSLSVAQNAKRNGVSEAAIRYYIKVNSIDRRFDRTQNLIADCRKYLKKHPNATKTELHQKTGHSLSTIRIYWEHITTEKELMNFDNKKKQKRQLRQLNNFYATHPSCTADILREEEFYKDVLEPFCGVGSMSEVIKQHGHNVLSYDIIDRGYGLIGDFYQVDFPRKKYDIVTNPPYDNVIDVVLRCLDICKNKVALLMPLRYLSSNSRYDEIYAKYPPARVYVYQERIGIAKNADFEKYNDAGANLEIYAWYIWERGFKGTTELKWISNQKTVAKKTVKNTAKVKELKEQIDALMKVEEENTAALKANPSYLPVPTKQEFSRVEQYNMAEHCCIAFRSKNDLWKGMQVPFGNMNGGYSYSMHGVEFPTSEHAYICGIFSNGTEIHTSIQKELLAEPSGYNAKRGIRNSHKEQWREDWSEFNLEWMLYCVWIKANECGDFRNLLMTLPQGTSIIEDVSFKPYNENGADFWGARNPEKKEFGKLAKKYARSLGLSTKKAIDEVEDKLLWEYCNIGTYTGCNVMGKILTYIKQCLHNGTEPDIDYELLKSKNIHLLGKLIDFGGYCKTINKSKECKLISKQSNQDNIKCSGKFAYFYMDTPLSNWWTSPPIPYDGHYFTSSEAVFMYLKAKGMGDNEYALKIVEADNDTILTEKERFSKVKKLGKKCMFDETTYLEKREEWMYTALLSKFEADETFRDTLMKEEYLDLTFVEASPWDAIWGIKSRATKKVLEEGESSWKGLNLLGKLLTRLRDENLKSGTIPNHNTDNLIKSICGGIFGDISGSTREKSSKSIYTTDFDLFPPKSHPTDDSVLTVAIADWLLHRDALSLTDALRGWGKKYPRAGFGGGFRNYIKTGIEYNSDKNGAAMRVSPAAVVATSLDEALALAKETAMPSHNSVEGIKGAQAIAASIFLVRDGVVKGKDTSTIKQEIKTYIEDTFGYDLSQSIESIRERSKGYAEMKKTFRATGVPNPEFRQMSDAAVSVPMAIIAFLEGNSYEEVLRIAISLGGDADTIGCMASSISVHLFGIPQGLYEDGCKLIPNDMKDIIDEFDAKYLSSN